MLITCYCYGFFLSNISTYHWKVASRPNRETVEWNIVHKRRRDHVDYLLLLATMDVC